MEKFLIVLFYAAISHAATLSAERSIEVAECADVLVDHAERQAMGFAETFPQIREAYPLLAEIVTGRVVQRTKSAGGAEWQELESFLSSCSEVSCSISLQNEKFDFQGTAQIVGEDANNKTMVIRVDYFVAAGKPDSTGRKKKIRLMKQSTGPNFQFLYLIGTIFSAAHHVLDRYPEVKNIRIEGGRVVNRVLAASLEEMGFKPTVRLRDFSLNHRIFVVKSFLGSYGKLFGSSMGYGLGNPLTTLVKSLSVLGYAVYEFRELKKQPADWTIEIPVR